MKLDEKFKKKFLIWLNNHPSVWHEYGIGKTTPFWYVQNCLGDLFDWSEEYVKFITDVVVEHAAKKK